MSAPRGPLTPTPLVKARPAVARARKAANGAVAGERRTLPQPRSDTVFAETARGRLEYFANDGPIGRALAEYGEWAELEIGVLLSFVEPGGTVVDVGANIGTHCLAFAQRVGRSGTVLGFEPQGPVFQVLKRNMAGNGCDQVQSFRGGVAAVAGAMRVPVVDYGAQANLGAVALQPVESKGGERVPIVTLDGLEMQACDLIKIDAEGMGPDVLAGSADTLRRLRPVVAIECNSIAESVAVWQARSWEGYGAWLLRAAAFNPGNFRRNTVNFFGPAHETTLIFAPEARRAAVPPSREGAQLLPIGDLDSLAAALLATPRYGDATAMDRDPEQLRPALARSEDARRGLEEEACAAAERTTALEGELAELGQVLERETQRLEFRAASLLKQLRLAEERLETSREHDHTREVLVSDLRRQLASTEEELAARDRENLELRSSTSWRITAPIRGLKHAVTLRRP